MRSVSVTMSVTVDGVVQGLGRPDEDTRNGFRHGGWGQRYQDEVMGAEMSKGMARPGDLVLGRRTWQDFSGHWPGQPANPITDHLNAVRKFVVSRSLTDVDAWQNSVLLPGDAVQSVRELKDQPGNDVAIIGSASLVHSLHAAGLIDRYTLLIHPLTLGTGTRMFQGAAPLTEFRLTSCIPTTTGVILAEYERI